MTTANEDVFLDTALTSGGRARPRRRAASTWPRPPTPGLTLDQPSISGGEVAAGDGVDVAITATQRQPGRPARGTSRTTGDRTSRSRRRRPSCRCGEAQRRAARDRVDGCPAPSPATTRARSSSPTRPPANACTSRSGSASGHLPTTDVLLVDDDGSAFGPGRRLRRRLPGGARRAGVGYDYIDVGLEFFPSLHRPVRLPRRRDVHGRQRQLRHQRPVPGRPGRASPSGSTAAARLWAIGQNVAETTDSNTDFESASIGRARMYHGYLGLLYETAASTTGPRRRRPPTASGSWRVCTSTWARGDGADNQDSIEATSPLFDNDTFQAAGTMLPLFQPIGSRRPFGSAVSFARGSDPASRRSG